MSPQNWNKAYTITTMSLHDHTYVVSIYKQESVSSVVELQPATRAFEFATDTSEDVLQPMRNSTGYIRYIYEGTDYDVRPSSMTDRYVEVTRDGTMFWQGFLMVDTFNQPYDTDPYEIEIPCQSVLGALEYVHMSVSTEELTTTPFGQLMAEAFDDLMGEEVNLFTYMYLPRNVSTNTFYNNNLGNSSDILRFGVYRYAFCDYDEGSAIADSNGFVGWNWKKIFEEYFRLYGACLHMCMGSLYLTIPTREDEYSRYTWAQIRGTGSSTNIFANKETLLSTVQPESTDNTTSSRPPKHTGRITLNGNTFSLGASVEAEKWHSPAAYNPTPQNYGNYYLCRTTCQTSQRNLTLESGIATPTLFDTWKTSDDSTHLAYSFSNAISILGNTESAPQVPEVEGSIKALTLTADFPLKETYYYSGLVISGRALYNYQSPDSNHNKIYASLHMGEYWWAGNSWKTDAEVEGLGYTPVFIITVDSSGNITTNSSLSSIAETYRRASEGTGYLMPLEDSMTGGYVELCIYEPFGYGSGDYQQICDLKVEFTTSVDAFSTIGYDYTTDRLSSWTHERTSGEFEKLLDESAGEEYSTSLNITNLTKRLELGWFTTPLSVQLASQYIALYYVNPAFIIRIGDAYAPNLLPNTVFSQAGVQYKVLSYGMNTYDDDGPVQVFKTAIGEQ